jgi:replication factor C subunit 1
LYIYVSKTWIYSKPPYSKENPGAKAVLLSGPPGIGKTTLATVVANQEGYEVLELNASDVRSKKNLQDKLEVRVSNININMKEK